MVSAADVVRHYPDDPDGIEWVTPPRGGPITVTAYDPTWPEAFEELAAKVRRALGDRVLALEHVGFTSVPGLDAKPIVDVDLTVADSADEAGYRAALEAEGFTLSLRERAWHEHRVFAHTRPRAHLHVWSPGCPEVVRHRLFRDWLREHPEDRAAYAAAKHGAVERLNAADGGSGMDYNALKEPVIHEILDRVFRAHGLL